MGNNQNGYISFMDFVNILSLYISLLNLNENQDQTIHNEMEAANTRQEKHLTDNLTKMFQEQNEILKDIQNRLERIERVIPAK